MKKLLQVQNSIHRALDLPPRRCASGAHFMGNCRCIGEQGLDRRAKDRDVGAARSWEWYYRRYGWRLLTPRNE